jgi:hypothetical protein
VEFGDGGFEYYKCHITYYIRCFDPPNLADTLYVD